MSSVAGEPCWIELFTHDTEAAVEFYGGLFGWTATEPDEEHGGYRIFERDGVPVAGLMRNDGSMGGPDAWSVYLATDDASALVDRARTAGAEIVAGPMQVGDLGTMAVLVDPAGATVGAWQAQEFDGTGVLAQDGAPAWFETLSTDYPASVRFYGDVFGWALHTMSDTPEFRYSTLGVDEDARAGIMDAAEMLDGQPSKWQFYLQVADADATVEQVTAAGGSVVRPPEDTPYGRLAVVRDRGGVELCLMGTSAGG